MRKRISRAGMRVGLSIAGRQRAGRRHRRLESQHRLDRSRCAVEHPVESAERDHRCADRALREHDDLAEIELSVQDVLAERPEDDDVRGDDEQQAQRDRPFAQARGVVLQLVQARASRDEAIDDPVGEAEQPELLAGRGVNGQAVGVVGVALRAADFVGVAIAPDAALAQQPVRGQPRAAEQQRRPPRVRGEHDDRREPADHLDQAAGDEVHRDRQRRTGHAEVEVARDREVARQLGIFEMTDARVDGRTPR